MIKIIIGIGNPPQYARTRHSVGQSFIDFLSSSLTRSDKLKGYIGSYQNILLYKSLSYMNLSGPPIKQLLSHYDLTPQQILVVHDDLDLVPGKVKIKKGGSSGGHHGLDSIIASIQTPDFNRLKIGIGKPDNKDLVSDYVLSKFTKGNGYIEEEEFLYEKVFPIGKELILKIK